MPGVVVFDGVCGLCSRAVQWIIRRDRHDRFRFAALQSDTGAALLREHGVDPARAHTILLVKEGRAYFLSDAVLEIARELPGWGVPARALALVPRRLRDRVYGYIARRRYRWFGKRDRCMMPTPETRAKFLE